MITHPPRRQAHGRPSAGPVELAVLMPPRSHPLAAHFRAHVEALGRRPDTALREVDPHAPSAHDASPGGPALGDPRVSARLVLALAMTAPWPRTEVPTLVLTLSAFNEPPRSAPTWIVAAHAPGAAGYDGLTRLQLLAQAAAAVLDHIGAASDPGSALGALVDASPQRDGLTLVLPATAHLSARALHELLATRVASEAARTLAEALATGDAWEALDWELPAALDTEAAVLGAALDAHATAPSHTLPDLAPLIAAASQDALRAAERVEAEVRAAVDDALATHGLAALRPLRRALERMRDTVGRPAPVASAPLPSPAVPSTRGIRAAERELAALARPIAGEGLLVAAWSVPTAALVALGVGPALTPDPTGPALAAAGTLAISALGAGISRALGAWRLTHARRTLATAHRDHDERSRTSLRTRVASLAPAASLPARTWLLERLADEDRRLEALEATALAEAARPSAHADAAEPAAGRFYRALSLAPLAALLAPRPDALVAQVQADLRGPWRERLPTLATLTEVARALLPRHLPWVSRRDLAPAIAPSLGAALDALDAELEHARPSGTPSRRLAFLPSGLLDAFVGPAVPDPTRPASALSQRLRIDTEPLPSSGDAHLLVLWGPTPDGRELRWGPTPDGQQLRWGPTPDGQQLRWGPTPDGQQLRWGPTPDGRELQGETS